MMESGNDGAAGVGLFVWLKSMANVIVEAVGAVAGDGTAAAENASAGDNCSSSYQILPSSPAGEKTKTTTAMMNGHQKSPDRNNNNSSLKPNGSVVLPPVQQAANGKVANGFQRLQNCEEEEEDDGANSSSSLSFNEEGESTHHHRHHRRQSKHIPEATTKLLSDENSENDDDVSTLPCCDIMKKKHQLCGSSRGGSLRRSSPTATENGVGNLQNESNPSVISSSTTKIPSNKIIEAIIEVIKKGELIRQFDPLVETKTANFHISPLVTTCMRNYTFSGLSNIEKAESEGQLRYLGPNLYSLDCVLLLRDLLFEAHYCIKLGGRWHRRPCLRNKALSVALQQATVYVELKFNTAKRTVRFERFSPISQRGVRVKTRPFAVANALFAKMLQRYAEKFLAANVVAVERQARRCLDRSALLSYEDIVARTALNTLFECFPRPVNTTNSTSTTTTTSV